MQQHHDAPMRDPANHVALSPLSFLKRAETVHAMRPAVRAAAVVARPQPKWGESPCAFVELREGQAATAAEVIAFCRDHIAHFKAPKTVVFGALPKTATGKIQKFILRAAARGLGPHP